MEAYHAIKKTVSEEVRAKIYTLLQQHIPSGMNSEEFRTYLFRFQKARDTNTFLRPTVSWVTYLMLGGDKTKLSELSESLAVPEILNSSTYIFNSVLDKKLGWDTDASVRQGIITGNLYRETAQMAVQNLEGILSHEQVNKITGRINEINAAIYQGQYLDTEVLTIANKDKFSSLEKFMEAYQQRNEGFSGSFYSFIPEFGGMLANAPAEALEQLANYGRIYGRALQIANDLGDVLIPANGTCDKPYKDRFSDLKNGKLTLPIYLTLQHKNCDHDLVQRISSDAYVSDNEREIDYKAFGKHLCDLGIYAEVRKLLNKHVKEIDKILDFFPKNEYRDMLKYQAATTLLRNKWTTGLKEYAQIEAQG